MFYFIVARRVVERGQHKVNNKKIEVCLHQPKQPTKQPVVRMERETSTEPQCIVRVEGISNVRSMETLEFYFDNARRSGGGGVKQFEVYKEDDAAYITFETEEGMLFSTSCPFTYEVRYKIMTMCWMKLILLHVQFPF